MSRSEVVYETNWKGLPYRVVKSDQSDEKGTIFYVEYRSNPRESFWGYRYVFHLKDGKYLAFGRDDWRSPDQILSWALVNGEV